MLTFKNVAMVEAVIFAILFVVYGFYPNLLLDGWGVNVNSETAFMGQRLASAFLSFIIILWMVRNLPRGQARRAISLGISVTLLMVAGFGLNAYLSGVAGVGIFSAIFTELLMASALLKLGFFE